MKKTDEAKQGKEADAKGSREIKEKQQAATGAAHELVEERYLVPRVSLLGAGSGTAKLRGFIVAVFGVVEVGALLGPLLMRW